MRVSWGGGVGEAARETFIKEGRGRGSATSKEVPVATALSQTTWTEADSQKRQAGHSSMWESLKLAADLPEGRKVSGKEGISMAGGARRSEQGPLLFDQQVAEQEQSELWKA